MLGVYKKWGKHFTDSKLNVEHPQHLSHIYDTLIFMVECWGSIRNGEKNLQI